MTLLLGPLALTPALTAVYWPRQVTNTPPLPVPDPRGTDYEYEIVEVVVPPGFPTQYSGLRVYYSAAVRELCLVAEGDAPLGMGGVIKIDKNGTLYAVYLVETTDPLATPVRVQTSTGIKAVRIKT